MSREEGAEKIFEEIMVQKFPNLIKPLKPTDPKSSKKPKHSQHEEATPI